MIVACDTLQLHVEAAQEKMGTHYEVLLLGQQTSCPA